MFETGGVIVLAAPSQAPRALSFLRAFQALALGQSKLHSLCVEWRDHHTEQVSSGGGSSRISQDGLTISVVTVDTPSVRWSSGRSCGSLSNSSSWSPL